MLPGPADNLCHSYFRLDDCTFGEQVPPYIVWVCGVLLNVLDLHLTGLTSLWVADCSKLSTK